MRDNDAIEKILEKYSSTVYRIAYLRTRSCHDASDIMQDVFVRYIRALPVFDSEEHEKAWFIRTTLNRTASFFSSAWYRRTAPLDENTVSGAEMPSDSGVIEEVKKLPKDIRTAIHLYYYEDMSVREIAEATGKSESAVKSLLYRGRKLLKLGLETETGTEKG